MRKIIIGSILVILISLSIFLGVNHNNTMTYYLNNVNLFEDIIYTHRLLDLQNDQKISKSQIIELNTRIGNIISISKINKNYSTTNLPVIGIFNDYIDFINEANLSNDIVVGYSKHLINARISMESLTSDILNLYIELNEDEMIDNNKTSKLSASITLKINRITWEICNYQLAEYADIKLVKGGSRLDGLYIPDHCVVDHE